MSDRFEHWDSVYQEKDYTQVSWYQVHSTLSFDWIVANTKPDDAIIDVGCGVSVLADDLLDRGYQHLSLLELSSTAIESLKQRLASQLDKLAFYNINILDFNTKDRYQLWHDRAVFHFLTDKNEQDIYLQKLRAYLKPGGYFLLATFAPDGPKQCSELDIVQYDTRKITQRLGEDFKLIQTANEKHPHPNGSVQSFNYFLLQYL